MRVWVSYRNLVGALVVSMVLLCACVGYAVISLEIGIEEDQRMVQGVRYFQETYQDCKTQFRTFAQEAQSKLSSLECGAVPGTEEDSPDAAIDYCFLSAGQGKVVIVSSGVHGVEGYAGSAIQAMLIEKYLSKFQDRGWSVLLLHGINSYGFLHNLRVTKHNVDLNRNFLLSATDFERLMLNSRYQELETLLSPNGVVQPGFRSHLAFLVRITLAILRDGPRDLRQVILGGQYSHPKGLYFGGREYEPVVVPLSAFLKKLLSTHQKVVGIDLHTGYGNRGELHLFPNKTSDHELRRATEKLFQGHSIDWGDSSDFYSVEGDFSTYLSSLVSQETLYIPMVFEYGTVDNLNFLNSLRSLNLMIRENQGRQFGYASDSVRSEIELQFREHYYPSDPAWRKQIVDDTESLIRSAFFSEP